MAEKPTAAFILSLLGGIFYLLVGIGLAAISSVFAFVPMAGLAIAAIAGIGLLSGILMIVGAVMMNTSNKSRVRTGSILVLVFTLVGAIFTAGGAVIGFILALIGSILGLTWNPSTPMAPPPTPPS
jgi:hypothetical protein